MKKHLLPITCLLAGLVFSVSCVEDIKGGEELAKNEIAFYISDSHTKADASPTSLQGATIPLGISNDDGGLALVETIETLDFAPVTKGTPAYMENAADLYGSFDAHVYGNTGIPDAVFTCGTGDRWSYIYDEDPWDKADPITFWMNMPVEDELVNVDGLKYNDAGTITFSYQSPVMAEDQQDILFTARTIAKDAYMSGSNLLTFFHALTGVKFAIGNKVNDTQITKVEFIGLYDAGTCTITPSYAAGAKSSSCVVWTAKSKENDSIYQSFDGSTVDFDEDDAVFGESFYAAGTENNINDEDASLTFWLVPQTLTSAVKLKVTFTVDSVEHTQTIDFGDRLKKDGAYPVWDAGQLRTYTLTSNYVDIDVTDTVGGTDNDTKSDVAITNTGNTNAFLRATIIGNWYDRLGKIVNVAWDTSATYGTFTYPTPAAGDGSWVLESDGFWYYTLPVLPGEHTNTALFTSYQRVAECPGYPSAKLQLSIAVQAVDAARITDARAQGWDPGTQQTATTPETPQN